MSIQPISSHLLSRIQAHQKLVPSIILQYDPTSHDLRAWFWPVTPAGTRVSPSELLDYRVGHEFQAPCCLCASTTNIASVTESAIYIAPNGNYSGEYVIGCASDRCGYLICIERLYSRRGLLLWRYPARPFGTSAPVPVPYLPKPEAKLPIVLSYGSAGLFASIPTYQRPITGPETVLDRLLRLDSWARPGLSQFESGRLFAKCQCGLVMTCRVFRNHICAVAAATVPNLPTAVIDLTQSDSDDSDSDDDFGEGVVQIQPVIIEMIGDEPEQ